MDKNANYYLEDDFEKKVDTRVWTLKRAESHSLKISKKYSYEGKSSLKVTVHKGNKQEVGNDGKFTERAELKETESVQIGTNIDIWYSFYFYMPEEFPINNNRLVFAQLKQTTKIPKRSPFISFRYRGGKIIFQTIYKEKRYKFEKKQDLRASWHRILLNYKLNDDLTGHANAWLDDDLLGRHKGDLGFSYTDKKIYFKMGLYRDIWKDPQTIYLDRFRRSSKRKDVI